MSQYANLLASQGNLSTAITYLPDNTNQLAVQQLRDRLSRALGQRAAAPAAPVQPQRVQPAPTQTRPAATAALPRHPFTPMQPAMVPQQPAAAPVPMPTPAASAPAPPQYYQPVRFSCFISNF
ncbi:protein transport protein Sec31A-like [Plectropomus leopardus]|uniref:protein transport protein Sec31A-like n=1 Tax=Plectropomus leopardus TaxID=160734 RepID=UPI001C4B0C70|nr:protein transport protein Sec31A-like [Plectropomus leopardus]